MEGFGEGFSADLQSSKTKSSVRRSVLVLIKPQESGEGRRRNVYAG